MTTILQNMKYANVGALQALFGISFIAGTIIIFSYMRPSNAQKSFSPRRRRKKKLYFLVGLANFVLVQ